MSGTSKRLELGQVVSRVIKDRDMTRHKLADFVGTSSANIERWERGTLAPAHNEWSKLMVFDARFKDARMREVYRQATIEQRMEIDGAAQSQVDRTPDLDSAIQLMLEAVPTLTSLTLSVDDEGDVHVAYKTREVRVVEDGGQLQIKRRAR